ncbi:MAG: hypothetical protein AAF039_14645 [Bacteroidota bacterium]
MKKLNFKYRLLLVGMVGLLFAACEDSDKTIDQIFEAESRGAALRTISVLSNSVAINSATNVLVEGETFGVILEHQDNEGGALLQEIEVYLSFVDNTDDDVDNSIGETLIGTIPASEFSAGEFGLPRVEYSITAQEMQTQLGLSSAAIGLGGDQFVVRFVTNLTDGRTFSMADNSGTLTGSFFSSPFQYFTTVVCAPSVPTAGDWIFDLQDSFGDGFNNATISVTIDGEETSVGLADGSEAQVIVNVPDGSETISIVFNSGAFDEEITFQVTSANGNVVVDVGPSPPVGSELLDFCPDNL